MRSVRSVVILNSELNQFHPDTIASEEMVIKALTKEDANEDVNEEEYLRNVAKERCEQLMSQHDFPRRFGTWQSRILLSPLGQKRPRYFKIVF